MQKRHIVRAERLSYTRLQAAVKDITDAGFDVEDWAMDTVFVGNGLIAVNLEPGDTASQHRIQELVWEHNGGCQVLINEDVDYPAVYSDLGVDIQN